MSGDAPIASTGGSEITGGAVCATASPPNSIAIAAMIGTVRTSIPPAPPS
jgi:hypothetical protein